MASLFVLKEVKYMNMNLEIEQTKQNIENYQKMLQLMPEDTILGRLCITAYLRREERKLQNLLRSSE